MFFLIRHGERADRTTKEEKATIRVSFDPHITALGVLQAKETGKIIKSKLDHFAHAKKIAKDYQITIISSPFLRCIQTANHILSEINESLHRNTLYIDEGITEWLNPEWFGKKELEHLTVYTMSPDEKEKLFGEKLMIKPYSHPKLLQISPRLNEDSQTKVAERFKKYFKNFTDDVLAEQAHIIKNVYILVTHGIAIDTLESALLPQILCKKYGWVDYCSTNLLYFKNCEKKTIKLEFDKELINYSEHISKLNQYPRHAHHQTK